MPDWSDNPRLEAFCARMAQRKADALNKIETWPPTNRKSVQWLAHGLRCALVHGPAGLCGYVHVPNGHPAERKDYDDVNVDVHGGLTFRQRVADGSWFGFDTQHAGDWFGWAREGCSVELPGKVWTEDDVRAETERLAQQLAEM